MNVAATIFEGVFSRTGSHVAVSIPIPLDQSIDAGHQDEVSEVKLSFEVEQGSFDVELDDVGAIAAIVVLLSPFQNVLYLFQRRT